MIPSWLHVLSLIALVAGAFCALVIAADECRRPQPMWIMNLVWPLIALSGSFTVVWFYFRFGQERSCDREELTLSDVAKAASHCGSGCTLGDVLAEALAYAAPGISVAFGWHWLFEDKIFATWVLDFVFAFAFGIGFQYFSIVPMRHLAPLDGLKHALRADTLSLISWQLGMYSVMAAASFFVFPALFHISLRSDMPEFWFVMQLAMIAGFATSLPVNAWLLRTGMKAKM